MDELAKIALALVTAAERIDSMDLTWIQNDLTEYGILTERCDGDTPVVSLRGHHVNVKGIDLSRLSRLATWVAHAVDQNHHRRFSRKELVKIVANAVTNRQVVLEDLKPKVRAEVGSALEGQ